MDTHRPEKEHEAPHYPERMGEWLARHGLDTSENGSALTKGVLDRVSQELVKECGLPKDFSVTRHFIVDRLGGERFKNECAEFLFQRIRTCARLSMSSGQDRVAKNGIAMVCDPKKKALVTMYERRQAPTRSRYARSK